MHKGIDGLRAYRVMMTLIYSLTQINEVYKKYIKESCIKKADEISLQSFLTWFDRLENAQKKQLFKVAVLCGADLTTDEILAVVKYRTDKNGVAYSKANVNNIPVKDMVEIISSVCLEMSQEEVFF